MTSPTFWPRKARCLATSPHVKLAYRLNQHDVCEYGALDELYHPNIIAVTDFSVAKNQIL